MGKVMNKKIWLKKNTNFGNVKNGPFKKVVLQISWNR